VNERRIQVRVLVSGTVQGVSYRAFTRREAEKLNVVGWVRNLDDGRVEGVFQGSQRAVDAVVAWCRRGPLRAVVTDVEVAPMPLEAFHGFDVRR
jgi:acylphosphatase